MITIPFPSITSFSILHLNATCHLEQGNYNNSSWWLLLKTMVMMKNNVWEKLVDSIFTTNINYEPKDPCQSLPWHVLILFLYNVHLVFLVSTKIRNAIFFKQLVIILLSQTLFPEKKISWKWSSVFHSQHCICCS